MGNSHSSYLRLVTAATLLVVVFGTIYVVTQQAQRSQANYPQVQIAEDTAASLDAGSWPSQLISGRIKLAQSLAPFTIIYNRAGQPVGGNGFLDGRLPQAPLGILTQATGKDYYTVTWEPAGDVRIAAVTVSANNYYVLSGRSLSFTEQAENRTFWLCFVGGIVSLAVVFIGYGLGRATGTTSKRRSRPS